MLSVDHFELFQLAPRFALDVVELDRAYQDVQSRVHPDRFASGNAAEKRVAMQWAARANEAYRALKSPLLRAAYLCERAGVPIEAETNTAMSGDFLTQQLEWREALEAAGAARDEAALTRLGETLEDERAHLIEALADAIDWKADFHRAASLVRSLMFLERLRDEIEITTESLPTAQRTPA